MKPLEIGDRVKVKQGSYINYKGAVTWVCVASVHVRLDCNDCELAFHSSQLTRLVKKKKPIRITSNGNNFKRQNTVTITKAQLAKAWDKHITQVLGPFAKSDDSYDFKAFCEALGFNKGEK